MASSGAGSGRGFSSSYGRVLNKLENNLSDYEKDILNNIDKHGWHCTYVFDPKGKDPSFAYSTGFSKTFKTAEFIIFGLSNDLMHSMLWGVYEQIEKGAIPQDGMVWEDLLGGGVTCTSRRAAHEDTYEEYARSAKWFWKHNGNQGKPAVYQIVWPGAQQGLLPWEEGCSQETIDMQTQLWETK